MTKDSLAVVPKEAKWEKIQAAAKQPTIGKLIDDAMVAIEKEKLTFKGVLLKDYARPALDKHGLGELIDIIANDVEPFGEKMKQLTKQLEQQFAESDRLEAAVRKNLEALGYGF